MIYVESQFSLVKWYEYFKSSAFQEKYYAVIIQVYTYISIYLHCEEVSVDFKWLLYALNIYVGIIYSRWNGNKALVCIKKVL